MVAETSSISTSSSRQHKRAYLRYTIDLNAKCCTQANACAEVNIRDFCLGGMFLTYVTSQDTELQAHLVPDIGDMVEIYFELPGSPPEKIHFHARVVRSDIKNLGIAFEEPESASLHSVLKYAKKHLANEVVNREAPTSATNACSSLQLLDTIRDQSIKHTNTLINAYLSKQANILLEMADKSRDASEQNCYFEALTVFGNKRDEFRKTFEEKMVHILHAKPEPISEALNLDETKLSSSVLSLIEHDDIDDWIARSDITSKSESIYFDELAGIEQRLSSLYNTDIDKQNNPIGPEAFSYAFQDAISSIHINKIAYQVCCKIFRDVLKDSVGELYKSVNKLLLSNNILPDLQYHIKKTDSLNKSTHTETSYEEEVSVDTSNAESINTNTPNPNDINSSGSINTGSSNSNGSAITDSHDTSVAGYIDTSSSNSNKTENAGSNHITDTAMRSVDSHKLYDLISSLQSIKNERTHSSGNHSLTDTDVLLPQYNAEEFIERLSEITIEHTIANTDNHDSTSMHSAILGMFHQLQQSPEGQRLGKREAGIMEITGSLYESLFTDNIITNGVKKWLSDVEMPLLKEAVKDESVLADKSHIARRFINQISQLELYSDGSRSIITNSVKTTIDELLHNVAQQPGMNEQLISPLLKKVDALVNIQNKAYNENLNDVLDRCEVQLDIPDLQANIQLPDNSAITITDSLREWRIRVRRLQIGAWILFNAGSAESIRLKVAWISENYDQYVFVNRLGIMEGSLKIDDLAYQLENGSAITLDNADEPAVDRAQYSMMQNLHNQLLHETTHDPTTGLLNRKEFENQLHEKLTNSSRGTGTHILCFIDLDYFDVINSTFGHEIGDKVLIDVASILSEVLNQRGAIARVGGDQFAILLLDCSLPDAKQITEQQRAALSKYHLDHDGIKSSLTFSSGIISIDLDRQNISRLLGTAEAACKLAKGKGINLEQVIETDDSTLHENQKIFYWAAKIDDCLINETLQLRYQPITPISDLELPPHAEILLGVSDAEGHLTSPEHFILAAERYRRMPEIDRWVVKNVFTLLKQNPILLEETGGVAINLSGLSVNDDSFITFILDQIENSGIPTSHLCFEITETAGVTNLSNAAQFINEIKQTGCSFSLDDFGTGMSSYSYLKNLPVDYIKIDGSFVRDIENNDSDKAVVKSVTEIGHFMGKKIIAECVEKESTIDLLREIGVDYAQGWAISKPKLFGK